MDAYVRAMKILETGTLAELEQLAEEMPGFPEGVDPYIGLRWIINAVSFESAGFCDR